MAYQGSESNEPPVWFITGGSIGIGTELARQAIKRGHRTVVKARDLSKLPGMRKRRRGCVVNLSSLAGVRGMPTLSPYNATKFAVEGLSEALRRKVEPLGIQAMVLNPSGFRIDRAGRSANKSTHPIDDCSATAGAVRPAVRALSGKPPHHLLLGKNAFERATAKVDELRKEFTAGEAVARGADSPMAAA